MFVASKYQLAIFDWVKSGNGNGAVSAVPGSGKSTTIRQIMMSGDAGRCHYLAFNRAIVDDFAPKIGGVKEKERWVFTGLTSASTFHSYGNQLLNQIRFGKIDTDKYKWVIKDLLKSPTDDIQILSDRAESWRFVNTVVDLIDKVRMLMIDPRDQALLIQTALDFDLMIDDLQRVGNPVGELIALALDEGVSRFRSRGVRDMGDMIYLPLRLDIKSEPLDWLFIDECQDLEESKRRFMTDVMIAQRTLAVGDPRQAIMGFTGASFNSFDLVVEALNATVMPLSVCYRCPKGAIDIANAIYPGIEPRDNAPDGVVRVGLDPEIIQSEARSGDLILCRLNAPLVRHCINLVLKGKKANIKGRDIGAALCEKLDRAAQRDGFHFADLVEILQTMRDEQVELMSRKGARADAITALSDLYDALIACARMFNAPNLKALKANISDMFADSGAQIWFSSAHRSKGLEAERVFILEPQLLPFLRFDKDGNPTQTFDELTQEMNLYYVAVTRPTKELWFLGYPSPTEFPSHALVTAQQNTTAQCAV